MTIPTADASGAWTRVRVPRGTPVNNLFPLLRNPGTYTPSLELGLRYPAAAMVRGAYWASALEGRSLASLGSLHTKGIRARIIVSLSDPELPASDPANQRTGLLLLSENVRPGQLYHVDLRRQLNPEELDEALRTLLRSDGPGSIARSGELDTVADLQDEVQRYARLSPRTLIVAPYEGVEPTAEIPSPATTANPGPCTAGVVTKNAAGQMGVTVPYHVFGGAPIVGTTTIALTMTNGVLVHGTIVSADPISDSCFAVFSGPAPIGTRTGPSAPLRGVSPRINQTASFEGQHSCLVNTIVSGADQSIGVTIPTNQVKIYTPLVTSGGDSGAALYDTSNILGFASFRTSPLATVAYSAWIWAESVFDAHGLN